MKRILVFIALIVLMNSCGAPKTLYYWGGEARGVTVYENLAYMGLQVSNIESDLPAGMRL